MKLPIQKGPLADFIGRKINSYREPSRKGTSKGEPIGFSRVKYTAMLLGLTNTDLRKEARDLGVGYGLLRKWRTEADFKKAMSSHAEEFVDEIIEALGVEVEKNDRAFHKFLSGPFRQLRNGWSKEIDINQLIIGAASWGAPIIFALGNRGSSLLRNAKHPDQFTTHCLPFITLMDGICEVQDGSKVFALMEDPIRRRLEPSIWFWIIDFTMKGLERGMSVQRRKKAVFQLAQLKRQLGRMVSRSPVDDLLAEIRAEKARLAGKGSKMRTE